MNMTTIPLIQNDRQRETLTSQFHVDALRAQHECGALGRCLRRAANYEQLYSATINGLWPLNERTKQERPIAVKQKIKQQKKQLFKGKGSRKSDPRVPYNSSPL